MTLVFEPETHTYQVAGKIIPSVTQILKELGLTRNYDGVDPFYRDRGSAVHKAIELYLKGTLDEQSIDPVCLPYFNAAREFLRTRRGRLESEVPLYSESMGFAGTIDLVEHDDDSFCTIYDAKCTESVDRATEPQLCAYQLLVEQNLKKKVRGKFPLQLRGDGTYELIGKYSDTDPRLWCSVMDIYAWKTRKKKA